MPQLNNGGGVKKERGAIEGREKKIGSMYNKVGSYRQASNIIFRPKNPNKDNFLFVDQKREKKVFPSIHTRLDRGSDFARKFSFPPSPNSLNDVASCFDRKEIRGEWMTDSFR